MQLVVRYTVIQTKIVLRDVNVNAYYVIVIVVHEYGTVRATVVTVYLPYSTLYEYDEDTGMYQVTKLRFTVQ